MTFKESVLLNLANQPKTLNLVYKVFFLFLECEVLIVGAKNDVDSWEGG